MYTTDNICKMIEYLTEIIFVQFGGCLFCQVIGIPIGTNYAPLLAELFFYPYANKFLDNIIRNGYRRPANSFKLCYRFIDDLIVFDNKKFLDYHKEIYPSLAASSFVDRGFWTKLGVDYGFLTSSPLGCGFEKTSG